MHRQGKVPKCLYKNIVLSKLDHFNCVTVWGREYKLHIFLAVRFVSICDFITVQDRLVPMKRAAFLTKIPFMQPKTNMIQQRDQELSQLSVIYLLSNLDYLFDFWKTRMV